MRFHGKEKKERVSVCNFSEMFRYLLETEAEICYNILREKSRNTKMDKMKRSMIPVNARQTLVDLIDEITVSLDELQDEEYSGSLGLYGEGSKAAYVHMLEFIQQRWEESEEEGLDFDIEAHFPV